jgi:hypothetical protein
MHTAVASTEKRGGRSKCLWGMSFLTATAVPPFFPGVDRSDKSGNLVCRTSHGVLVVSLKKEPRHL